MLVDQGWAVSFMLYSGITDFIGSHASVDILDPGVWNSITVSYDGGTTDNSLRFYKNGTLFDDVSYQSNGSYTGVNQVAEPFYIGSKVKDNGTPHIQLNGIMDEVTVWDRALSDQEIQSYFSTSPVGNEDGLYGYWNLNEGEGSVLTDLSDYGNNGTVVGATWSGNSAPVEPPVLGCTDSYAENYSPDATADDGSCEYEVNIDEFNYLGNYNLSLIHI